MPDEDTPVPDRMLSRYGLGSLVLGIVAVVAVVLAVLVWSGHRSDVAERVHQTDVLQAAADWTGVLINMNKDTAGESLQKLRDGTVGQLNVEFDNTVEPFSALVTKLQAQTVGQVESVSIETLHHAPPGDEPVTQPELATVAARTDTVLVVATSVSQNAAGKPATVRWNLRLDVSDVDGKLLISHLETIR